MAWPASEAGGGGSSEGDQEAASSGEEQQEEVGPSRRPGEQPGAAAPSPKQEVQETPPDSVGRGPLERGRLRQGDIRAFLGAAAGG